MRGRLCDARTRRRRPAAAGDTARRAPGRHAHAQPRPRPGDGGRSGWRRGPKLRCGPVRREIGRRRAQRVAGDHALGGRTLALHASGGATGAMVEEHLARRGRRAAAAARGRHHAGEPRGARARRRRAVPLRHARSDADRGGVARRASTRRWRRRTAAYVVASGSLPPGAPADVHVRLARALAPGGTRLLVDTSGPALRESVAGGVHLVKVNYREFDELGGRVRVGRRRARGLAARIVSDGAPRP